MSRRSRGPRRRFRAGGDAGFGARLRDRTPVLVSAAPAALDLPTLMSCAIADRLARFDEAVVQPAARRLLGAPVIRIEHFGTFACRMESDGRRRLSEHASGKAIDVAGFVLADGRRIRVVDDRRRRDQRGAFLRDVARRACGYFSVVLTPGSDAAHRSHVHLDIGPYRLCGAP